MRRHSSERAYSARVLKLSIVPKTTAPESERRRQRLKVSKPAALIECRCGCREVIETKFGVLLKDGRPQGGTKKMICAACFAKGERVVLS